MKKIALFFPVFIMVFIITCIVKFPYVAALSHMCDTISRNNRIDISWAQSSFFFPVIKLGGVRIVAADTELATFEKFDLKLFLVGISFKGAKEPSRISGKIKPPVITYNLSNLPIPENFGKSLGKGTLNLSGEFNYREKKGAGKLNATIDEFPNPLIPGSATIEGNTKTDMEKTELSFAIQGANLTGKGTINFSQRDPKLPMQVSGLLDLKVRDVPVMINLAGDINNVTISTR